MIYQIKSIEELFNDNNSNLESLNELGNVASMNYGKKRVICINISNEQKFDKGYSKNPYFKVFNMVTHKYDKGRANNDLRVIRVFIYPRNGVPTYTHHPNSPEFWKIGNSEKQAIDTLCRSMIINKYGVELTVWEEILRQIGEMTGLVYNCEQPDYTKLEPDDAAIKAGANK